MLTNSLRNPNCMLGIQNKDARLVVWGLPQIMITCVPLNYDDIHFHRVTGMMSLKIHRNIFSLWKENCLPRGKIIIGDDAMMIVLPIIGNWPCLFVIPHKNQLMYAITCRFDVLGAHL